MKFYLMLLISVFISVQAAQATIPEFVILVTSYNNEKYAERNLASLVCQKTQKPFQIICVNDCSTDKTGAIMDRYAQQYDFIKVIHNKERVGSALENMYHTIHTCIDDHKVVVCVDGDDTLAHSGVLTRLEKEYDARDIWMTYGRFVVIPEGVFWSACWGYPEEVIQERSFRKDPNVPSHLKTFKAGLFKKIKKEDLLDTDGRFYRLAWDMALLFPLLEMCAPYDERGINHSSFIADTVMYVYNFDNPLSDFAKRDEQIAKDRAIRAKEPYEPLETL